jgi:hypothetical protein
MLGSLFWKSVLAFVYRCSGAVVTFVLWGQFRSDKEHRRVWRSHVADDLRVYRGDDWPGRSALPTAARATEPRRGGAIGPSLTYFGLGGIALNMTRHQGAAMRIMDFTSVLGLVVMVGATWVFGALGAAVTAGVSVVVVKVWMAAHIYAVEGIDLTATTMARDVIACSIQSDCMTSPYLPHFESVDRRVQGPKAGSATTISK